MGDVRGGLAGAVAAEEGADNLSITLKGLTLVLRRDEVMFLKTILAVVCRRQEFTPSWTTDNLGAVKACHLIVSTAALLSP
jgi:hypothetical protein